MKTLFNVKGIVYSDGCCNITKAKWIFDADADIRIKKAAERITVSSDDGLPVYIHHGTDDGEQYALIINEDRISIKSDSAAGAFYALMTLNMLIKQNGNTLRCCEINDYPDMKYRGFYQDITRGRVPKLETLKKLADTLAEYKINSLQLYVEHCFDFREYDFCRDEQSIITAEEIRELDKYCKERFIDLVPSLSCFGHLYHLLQSDKYKHLCELRDFEPQSHYFIERLAHHTINPLLDESFELICSLIDQHMAAFTSNYFNICCDETFDLGTDVNKDKKKDELYIGFVQKLIGYVESKGKTVMMWSDIILKYPEHIEELSDKLVFLNWGYSKNPDESRFQALKDKTQIICPGTSSWYGFSERPCIEEENIINSVNFGYKYGAFGVLNTNWGDFGNLACIDMAAYGLIIGAMVGWDKNAKLTPEVKRQISEYHYGNSDAVSILEIFGEILNQSNWRAFLENHASVKDNTPEDYISAEEQCKNAIEALKTMPFSEQHMKDEFINASKGYSLLVKWQAKKAGFDIECETDFEAWLSDYKKAWLENSKQTDLPELEKLFSESNSKYGA